MRESVDRARNYRTVLERISRAAEAAARDPAAVKLVVVTKGQPLAAVEEVAAAGARCLGENYVEEALPKIEALSGQAIEWRMIGHLQSRKARQAAEWFDGVDTVDSLKLARRLNRFCAELGKRLPVLVEFNVSGEESKFGWPAWQEASWPALAEQLAPLSELENLQIRGLMSMPPYFDQPERVRPYFQRLRRLQAYLAGQFPQVAWDELSMGMSGDFEVAIEEGATMVRVGTAIMGPRQG